MQGQQGNEKKNKVNIISNIQKKQQICKQINKNK